MTRKLWWLSVASVLVASCSKDDPSGAVSGGAGVSGSGGAAGVGAAGGVAGASVAGSAGSAADAGTAGAGESGGAAGSFAQAGSAGAPTAAGTAGTAGAPGGCSLISSAWTGDGAFTAIQAECAHEPDVGDCNACISGSNEATSLQNLDTTVRFDTGSHLMYSGVDLTGMNAIGVRYASAQGGTVEIRVDSTTGTLIGTWTVAPTGGAFKETRITIEPVNGEHDLYIVGTSGRRIASVDYLVAGICTPDCAGKTCGEDGCGGLCGECQGSDFCDETSNCQACVPDCAGKLCGDDTCGGSCGSPCASGEVCNAERVCVEYDTLGGPPRLQVDGRVLRDSSGTEVIVRGVSLIDIGQQHANRGGIPGVVDLVTGEGWNTEIVRMPVYPTGPQTFPLTDHFAREIYMRDILRPAVDYATQKGLYVIVDWHEIASVNDVKDSDAQAFWSYMARQFADYPNVIYELFNEPTDNAWACTAGENDDCWPPFKARAQGWVDIVRSAAPSTLVLVGGPSWSQVIGPAADDPIDDTNVAYVGHIYPRHITEGGEVEAQIRRCAAVHPVFLTEWGYGFDATDRTLDKEPYATTVKTMADELGLHFTAWAADYAWGPPMFVDSTGTLTDFGAYVKAWLAE